MTGHGEKLSRYQESAISALLTEPTVAEAAEKAGVSERTLRRWLSDSPEFVGAYRRARLQVVEAAISHLQQASAEAVATLRRNMDCGNPHAEIRAALGVMDLSIKGAELLDLEARIEELEDLVGASSAPGANR